MTPAALSSVASLSPLWPRRTASRRTICRVDRRRNRLWRSRQARRGPTNHIIDKHVKPELALPRKSDEGGIMSKDGPPISSGYRHGGLAALRTGLPASATALRSKPTEGELEARQTLEKFAAYPERTKS